MKSIILHSLIIFLTIQKVNAQEVSCDELQKFIEQKAYQKNSLHSYILNSSWLYKVTAYDYDFKIYVVAEIKESEYSYSTRTYIFCGIPSQNWSNFVYGGYGDSDSYGERFHKYILNYTCNCY
ncbi:hypothetical protein [uncultured Croceitalea sp.]|uniref:hypothetical protein n=1 Tax=uncultured Croceitalea sp. TaxID=1798908 RepID=UPI00330653A1